MTDIQVLITCNAMVDNLKDELGQETIAAMVTGYMYGKLVMEKQLNAENRAFDAEMRSRAGAL